MKLFNIFCQIFQKKKNKETDIKAILFMIKEFSRGKLDFTGFSPKYWYADFKSVQTS